MSGDSEPSVGGSVLVEIRLPSGEVWAKKVAFAMPVDDVPTSIKDAAEILAYAYARDTPHEARLTGAVDLSHMRVDHRHAHR